MPEFKLRIQRMALLGKQISMRYSHIFLVAFITLLTSVFIFSCDTNQPSETVKTPIEIVPPATVEQITYTVTNTFLHDTTAFTEGFFVHEGKLFESTGSAEYYPYGKSSFGIVDLEKGKLDIKSELDKKIYFGEGIVILNEKLYQLTYTTQIGFVYDAKSYKRINQFNYSNKEGWGLTTDGKNLIMSDGTFNLTFLNPDNFQVIKTLPVTEEGYGLDNINELEYINGFIYANVWMSNYIVKIDPQNGKVLAKLNLNTLYEEVKAKHPSSLEMNGIAYNPETKKVFVTGKFWPNIYEIEFKH